MKGLPVTLKDKDNYLLSGELTSASFPSINLDFITNEITLEFVISTVSDLCFAENNLGDLVELKVGEGGFKRFEYIHSDSKSYTFLLKIRTNL
ncbi:hypothetical protein AAH450_07815 [Erwinia sp. P7711]|uniref:hypothetical protein n=1 Tax=Erwinia sp. P7711 TaxID=3141451 RepID=UPI00318A54AF